MKGDPITPVVLQKVQPLIVIVAARLILGEQPRRGFVWFVIPALLGIWLIAFPQPFDVHASGLEPIALALGAAVLWGLGTVFGRYLSRRLPFEHVVTVRFSFGLIASAIMLVNEMWRNPVPTLAGGALILAGVPVYYAIRARG